MTLRTPRRRISPRTKRRCRVIRNFFRRALGSSSQPEIKISSSIAVNVTDLKHKIAGLEHKLNTVSQHCQELACFETLSKNSSSLGPEQNEINAETNVNPKAPSKRNSKEEITKVLYKTSESHYKQSDESDYGTKYLNDGSRSQANVMNTSACKAPGSKRKKKKSKLYSELNDYDQNLSKRRSKSVYENFGSFYSTSSYHSVIDPRMAYVHKGDYNERQNPNYRREYIETEPFHLKDKKIRDHVRDTYKEEKRIRSRKSNHNRELDQDFIADIIKRQYKPMKMFGRKESDISQFSAPVCRDQDYLMPKDTRDTDLCSCCYESRRPKPKRYKDLTDMRSICDTRLYSSNRQPRTKQDKRLVEVYNDSDFYDLVPVKEKSSPKSRRKFAEDNIMAYSYYKEVPPSPRTHRPRLNLKAQYFAEFEDFLAQKRQNRRISPAKPKRNTERGEIFETDTSEMPTIINQFSQKQKLIHPNKMQLKKQNTGTVSSLHSPKYGIEIIPEIALNKTEETDVSIDKTDKALSEIKDILQSFLLEIKKETTTSQCDKSDVTSKVAANDSSNPHNSANVKPSMFPHSGHSFNYNTSCNMPSCMPAFPNTCCYPVLPMCTMNPMSCMQNGYAVPTPSFTCATCANKETAQEENPSKSANNTTKEFCNPGTEELIKEIYKYVAQSPKLKRNDQESERRETDKLLTSRSVGGSARGSKRDAKVGTPKMKCYSKSCEAISTKLISDTYYSGTNASYSDTLLEKLSVEATPSDYISETDFTTETSMEKGKNNKLVKVLRTFGLMKKKKDVIEELSESESTIDVEIKPKPPFKQNITNYMMHGQEYYQPPPVPHMHHYPHPDFHEHHPYVPRFAEYPPQEANHPQRMHHTPHTHNQAPYNSPPMPSAPPYSQAYDNYKTMQQNVPLCLKEIEVKSIGTQSERKMSFFRKMKTKIQPPGLSVRSEEMPIKNCSTQTAQSKSPPALNKPNLFNWKNLQKPPAKMDPSAFSYMKQNQLAQGDFKIRDAMVKKLFYKRNPFSPRNLLVRTILGKDKSSYGDPPAMYRPRMFF